MNQDNHKELEARLTIKTVDRGGPVGIFTELYLDGKKIAEQVGMDYANWMIKDKGSDYLVQYGQGGLRVISVDSGPRSMIEPLKGTGSSDPRSQDKKFYEAEYKLQNCLRITLNVENFKTEVEYLPDQFQEVAKYVQELLALREREARIAELGQVPISMGNGRPVPAPWVSDYVRQRVNELKKGEE